MKALSTFVVLCFLSIAALGQTSSPLQQAHQEFDSGHYSSAAQMFRTVVAAEPDNTDALAGLVDSLEASGQWRAAVEPLEHLVALEPNNASRAAQLGRWKSWEGGNRTAALESLSRACALDKTNPQPCTDYADVLSWRTETRTQAVTELRAVLAKSPNYVPAMKRLAEILSWNKSTHAESVKLFESAVKLDPDNSALLASYADALMYDKGQRQLAISLYDRALRGDPKNAHILASKAQLLAWSGKSKAAMQLYEEALAIDPDNVAALRGKAEILNWHGEYEKAHELLQRARRDAPDDSSVSAELARSEMGLQHYGSAHQTISGLPQDEEYRDIRENVSRALGSWAEAGVGFRRNGNHLHYDQLNVAVSTPMGFNNRLTFEYSPTLYSTPERDFNSNNFGFRLDSKVTDHLSLALKGGTMNYPGVSPEVEGGLQLRYRIRPSIEIQTGFDRSAVDESLLSLRGTNSAGLFTGQVASNLGNIGLHYDNARHGYDFTVAYTDGYFTGRGLDSNRRWSVDGNVGKSLGGTPYIRVGYGFSYTSFEFDADAPLTALNRTGGYFSPTGFLLNYGSLTVSHKFSERLSFEATGTAGAQNVDSNTSSFDNTQFASTFMSRLMWRPSANNEIRIEYDFLNVFSAFHRHLPSITWRHYF